MEPSSPGSESLAAPPRRRLVDEAKEASGITSTLLLGYVEREGGPEAVRELLARCGLDGCEEELRDENTWFSWETKIALFQQAGEVLGRPNYFDDMALFAMDTNIAGALKVALRTLGSPQFVLRNIVRANGRFVRTHVLELLDLGEGRARLRFSAICDPPRYHRLDCEYTSGLLAVIPGLFGLPPAHVSHPQCAAEGAESCIFELRWRDRPAMDRRVLLAAPGLALTAAASTLLVPAALPVVAGGAGVAAALALRDRVRWRRQQWRHLERQLQDSEQVAQRLFASLQDLVSDLRLEEVVAKVIRNAQDAVGGRDFLLLVREGERLTCQESSDLPPAAVSAVEDWANGTSRALSTSLLLDDVTAVAPLAPLAELDNPLCSLASAPLTSGGSPFGVLVSLGGQQQNFLPSDISILESYAAQVAIALGNAQLYQSQRSLAARDPLTGLLNHRSFHEALAAELDRCAREQFISSLVLIDLDRFKAVNDADGHAAGDGILRAAARAMSDACRREDLAFRIGGDEFVLLLPRLTEAEAASVARRVCQAVGAIDGRIGASAGVASARPGEYDKDSLIAEADRRLYDAKRSRTQFNRASLSAPIGATAVELLTGALRLHHGATANHSDGVSQLAVAVARRLGLSAEQELVGQTALLHDLGKLAIPAGLLDKPSSLSAAEWEIVRRHPSAGAEVLRAVPGLEHLAAAVRASHERWDGTGYPDGLSGGEIPLAARIVSACDAYEAMTANRPYRPPLTLAEAIDELRAGAGTQFDPVVVAALVAELTHLAEAA